MTKIVNQVDQVAKLIKTKNFTFKCQDFSKTLAQAKSTDLIYCDPLYIDAMLIITMAGMINKNTSFLTVLMLQGEFILSTWHHNAFRRNEYIQRLWKPQRLYT